MRPAIRIRVSVFVTILAAAMLAAIPTNAKPVLRVTTDLDCPWMCMDEDTQQVTGILPDLSAAIFVKSPWRLDVVTAKWTSGRKRLATGKVDALVARLTDLSGDSHLGLSIAPSAIGLSEQAIWAPRNNPFTWRGIDSLKQKRLAVDPDRDNGLTLLFYFESLARDSRFISPIRGAGSAAQMLHLLTSGKIDLAVHDSAQLAWQARVNGFETDVYEATRLDTEFLYIAFTRRNADAKAMTEWYEESIKALRESGKLKKILKKYGQKDWLVY